MINYLSQNQKKIIQDFNSHKIPLFIFGQPGIGKTTLAKELLKDTLILKIDTNDLKKHKDIQQYISDSLGKKNITMMFQKNISERSLLVDDLDIFYKNDRSGYNGIIDFLINRKYHPCKVILTMNMLYINNRSLKKVNFLTFQFNYSPSNFYKIIVNILSENKIKLTSDQIDAAIYNCKMNLNTFLHNLNIYQNKIIIQNDSFDSIETVANNILINKYSMDDILKLCENDENIIGLNLLENIAKICPMHAIPSIYETYVLSDLFETFTTTNHLWELKKYSILFSIYSIHMHIHKQCKLIYNKYISKSLIQTHSNKLYHKYNKLHENSIYYYLYMINILKDKSYDKYLKNINPKLRVIYEKKFHNYYK